MLTRNHIIILIAVAACGLSSLVAHAGITYRFITDQSAYPASPGDTITAQVFLQEVLGAGDTSAIAADNGLFSLAAGVNRGSAGATTPAQLTDWAPNPAFDGTTLLNITPGSAALYQDSASGTGPGPMPGTGGRILVGTLTIQAGLTAGEITPFSITDFDTSTDDILTYAANILDPSAQPASFTVTTAIPEPSALLIVFGAMGLLARSRQH